ncbi:T9SS type A sorting domain-containing protein [uncultured Prevotella sp.]|uniref:T9SS type A sorting domain-containing protein n=1 Tax=uncultured Prevotella sp. TaxID=159272 RepID=UPI0025D09C8A|nr:T9SS type A sorting domain-containing protein [uncultured Prevotella sp.]
MRKFITILILGLLSTVVALGQEPVSKDTAPKIGGNVYGGGNKGKVKGNTNVTVKNGDLNNVYAGARMADVGGRAYVNIDGEEASGDIFITNVYGGNDIAGTIGSSTVPVKTEDNPRGLTDVVPEPTAAEITTAGTKDKAKENYKKAHPETNIVDETWNAYVRTSRSSKVESGDTIENYAVVVGSLFGGGNGEYKYEEDASKRTSETKTYDVYLIPKKVGDKPIATITVDKDKTYLPVLGKTYLEIKGGCIAHLYGGGNNATVTDNTTISIRNESQGLSTLIANYAQAQWSSDSEKISDLESEAEHSLKWYAANTFNYLKERVQLKTFQAHLDNTNFNFARVYGGNNKADMAIRPTWNLQKGLIRDLYSGGNEGRMTSPTGLLLEIDPIPYYKNALSVYNVYGGCRRSDVRPLDSSGEDITVGNLPGYNFPTGLAARTLVRGGQITNVYGGNDISGTVYGGNAIGIYTTVYGDVYGGGNGSYAYTDNADLGAMDLYKDFYYDVNKILDKSEGSTFTQLESAQALNKFRPNAEQVSIRLKGNGPGAQSTIIHGGVYCGGNSASMDSKVTSPMMEIKFGSHVVADNVFLGNNGTSMLNNDILELYAGRVKDGAIMKETDGSLSTSGGDGDYSTLFLTSSDTFAEYMDGVVMTKLPDVVFDGDAQSDKDTYDEFSSYVGSFFCGGNVGSMAIPGHNSYSISHGLNIYDKFVGGCNNANVAAGTYNADYEGGVLGAKDERGATSSTFFTDTKSESGAIKDRLEINLENLTITPLRWNDNNTDLIWNTNKWGYPYTAYKTGTELTAGTVYYTYTPYVEHTVPTGGITVTASDQYYRKETVDDKVTYSRIAAETALAAGSTYYTYVANNYTKHTVPSGGSITADGSQYSQGDEQDFVEVPNSPIDEDVRLLGGNVYGGCYNSGHVNGNVVINIKEDVLKKENVFGTGTGIYGYPASGVELLDQRDDVMAVALSVFGAGYGEDTEIWGSTTVNLHKGYAFQVYGGGEKGVVGKKNSEGNYEFDPRYSSTVNLNGRPRATSNEGYVEELAETEYIYGGGNEGDVCGNTYVNLGNGRIYDAFGGASDANILGHTEVYIGRQPNGSGDYKSGFPWVRDIVYGGNDFGGTIEGHYREGYDFTSRIENYDQKKAMIHGYDTEHPDNVPDVIKAPSTYVEYLRGRVDTIFGGGYGYYDYTNTDLYGAGCSMPVQESSFVNLRPVEDDNNEVHGVFGGSTGFPGNRDGDKIQDRSYVLVDIPNTLPNFKTTEIFGSGSYNGMGMKYDYATSTAAGFDLDKASCIIDLLHGQIGNVIGGSYNEGVTRRTVINVPNGSTISMYSTEPDTDDDPGKTKHLKKYGNIFGGAYGTQILPPCDVYESNVNYNSSTATVMGYIYGGNNNERRTLYAKVNIYSPVYKDLNTKYTTAVFGAGLGQDTWAEYTEVNLWPGASVYEVYGGGMMGHVLNDESVQKYMQLYKDGPSDQIAKDDPYWNDESKWSIANGVRIPNTDELKAKWAADWKNAWTLGSYFVPTATDGSGKLAYTDYVDNTATNLANSKLARTADMDDRDYSNYSSDEKAKRFKKYDTNVIIHEGATVSGYAYGGGYGKSSAALSGDVYGTTYIALLGGTVKKDLYAAGTSGSIYDLFGVGTYNGDSESEDYNPYGFTASANVYVKGGSVRNVYGGGWEGGVGYHAGDISTTTARDIDGETHVVIGDIGGSSFTNGKPTVQRNAYGGGEGGAVFGTTNITVNNGYIGYVHLNANQKQNEMGWIIDTDETIEDHYEEKIIDDTYKDQTTGEFIPNRNLDDAGNVFGGGYVDNSSVDKTHVKILGGHIRNSAFGGGEIAAIGRGAITETKHGEDIVRTLSGLYRPGKTHIEMYGGHVNRNVFGGGRGYDNLGRYGKLHADGCVFGQTEVHIHGGEIGSAARLDYGDGNVFGGGDIGYVYSAYENADGSFGKGVSVGVRYNAGLDPNHKDYNYQGYYYKHKWADDAQVPAGATIDNEGFFTEKNEKGDDERMFTEDCKVLIEPHCMSFADLSFTGIKYAKGQEVAEIDLDYLKSSDQLAGIDANGIVTAADGITFDRTYLSGSYVPTAALNTLGKKNADRRWDNLDPYGIIIHNAVFAGGNTPSGKSVTNANVASVFGNATASINDVYHRDLISLGTNHQGGLYGDGNLTLVDGYRELNITNYGTDYYSIAEEITIDQYKALPAREADYYELKFTCIENCTDKEGTNYKKSTTEGSTTTKASTITYDELLTLFLTEKKDNQGNIIYVEGTQTPVMVSIKYNNIDVLKKVNDEWMPNSRLVDGKDKPYFWEESGVLPVYAGRPMNTIQRADFCGVWGSRMVMQGARDRVPDEVDLTNYTINRVREVSLNKKISSAGDAEGTEAYQHGNYFGIYNIVNYLGALSSDVDFGGESDTNGYGAIRTTDNENTETYGPDLNPTGASITLKSDLTADDKTKTLTAAAAIPGVTVSGETITANTVEALYKLRSISGLNITGTPLNQTFYDWKKLHHNERKRNNGNSHNKVALASGVYLEITTEESTGNGLYEKVWGPITGVVELDLINVSTGIGGGFVYAKNIHGVRSKTGHKNTTLTALNSGAVTHWDYEYSEPSTTSDADDPNQKEWETSGNFVHSTQTIIDDCYNISNRYLGTNRVPAHYWYIKGSVYVYDQYISAYTGSPNAFSEAVDIPLTITAASHGSMKLLDVKPNRYAYYSQPGVKLTGDKKISIGDKTYSLNDPISYWDWYLMSASERALFIENTYVNCVAVNIDNEKENGEPKIYAPGTYVMTESEFNNFGTHTYKNAEGEVIEDADKNTADKDYIFRPSNDLGHDTGYMLTYQVNNPGAWDTWYTPKTGNSLTGKITKKVYNTDTSIDKDAYEDGPTYRLDTSKLEGATSIVLGQSDYKVGDLISKSIEDAYPYTTDTKPANQADFEKAYIIIDDVTITEGTDNRHLNPGATISATQKSNNNLTNSQCDEAYICTKTIQLSKTDLIYRDTKMSKTQALSYLTGTDGVNAQMNALYTGASAMTTEAIKALATSGDFTSDKKSSLLQLANLRDDLTSYLVPAYYCTKDGKYGGSSYGKDVNYRGLEAWSSMSESDRDYFIFNYDALDLLIDPTYGVTKTSTGQTVQEEGKKYQYDGNYTTSSQVKDETTGNKARYSLNRALDYTATYKGSETATYNTITLSPNHEYTSEEYEKLPNEQRHYVAIHVKDGKLVEETTGEGESAVTTTYYKVYVVNNSFQIGNTPYAVGSTITYETFSGLTDQSNITVLTFPEGEKDNTYYYCRESYEVDDVEDAYGTAVTNLQGLKDSDNKLISGITGTQGYDADGNSVSIKSEAYTTDDVVPIGLVINATNYDELEAKNKQKNFTFHGISPTETSTLYVSRESNIYNLSKDKIITVIYQYDYEESDNSGNVTPVSERHVLNIHIKFESGVPVVEDITKPDIILPGDFITIGEPNVLPGAYEVTGGGWELFETQRDAESHVNGRDYNPTFDPLYWYQHDWYVAYYAKSYLGRTYSNAVPVSVANYHDLANVMSDGNKTHHMYIDHEGVKRDPKIYINDYSKSGQNGLDLLKDLFDLSLITTDSNNDGLVDDGKFKDHHLLASQVKGGANLDFFLRTDIDHSKKWVTNPAYNAETNPSVPEFIQEDNPWTPIASGSDPCFEGTLHGDGHTISGLNPATGTTGSLFNKLCGNVYNLGVMGSFTGAGVADTGDGYVESCWVKTTGTTPLSTKPYPVFGDPTRTSGYQVVNSYYSDSNKDLYNIGTNDRGTATQMADEAFYNGEVAYDLNNFYLHKRHAIQPSGTVDETKWEDRYFTVNEDNTLTLQPYKVYADAPTKCSSGHGGFKYVEDRFANEDFLYAAGSIPTSKDERYYTETVKDPDTNKDVERSGYYPIYPDDYLFFGQKLTYGWAIEAHQDVPTAVVKDNTGRLSQTSKANRVYRAPAYYRSSKMNVAHFNPDAYLAQKSKDGTKEAHPNMTAIDFAGHNNTNEVTGTYVLGWDNTTNWFYLPLLDDDGLQSIVNCDETQNLLVYAPQATTTKTTEYANQKTYTVLNDYFVDPAYSTYYKYPTSYRIVEEANTSSIRGHLVQNDFTATSDHLLVDKQDFNAPMGYTFASNKRMWYQRTPSDGEFVDRTKGWQGISIPFTAELVTTDQKGEITHFYSGSRESENNTHSKIGHEYWLREFTGITTSGDPEISKANFTYPDASSGDKNYTNTFLWDYYYKNANQKDANKDTYQTYYQSAHTHSGYPLLQGKTPYLIGFPGQTYYEFDLSGSFKAQHTDTPEPDKLDKQTITFASQTGISIGVSDSEMGGVTKNGYTFKPSYMNEELAVGNYVMNSESNAYNKLDADAETNKTNKVTTSLYAFRPYFEKATNNSRVTRSIIFSNDENSDMPHEEYSDGDIDDTGKLIVKTSRLKIDVKSTLKETVNVRILTMNGITINTFALEPGQTVETRLSNAGVYIVQSADGKLLKKLTVR